MKKLADYTPHPNPKATPLDQFKYVARQIKLEERCTHTDALEKLARLMGFRNYTQAYYSLKDLP